ncbi:hypothetical protein FGO68_gene17548 [Halteria grandinella]|uniref:Uncharacterized protein n=1 Tax=Halteria grandinella TaxID=5974 RepID=A0A8J8T0W3_HALGN|nr:hypothetical protein FGO68_gene17548 [Halteria grandinella]
MSFHTAPEHITGLQGLASRLHKLHSHCKADTFRKISQTTKLPDQYSKQHNNSDLSMVNLQPFNVEVKVLNQQDFMNEIPLSIEQSIQNSSFYSYQTIAKSYETGEKRLARKKGIQQGIQNYIKRVQFLRQKNSASRQQVMAGLMQR